jgi:thiol-disulfide isomerase/thioredoxin
MYKYYAICAALSLYISTYTLLGFATEPMRMDFLMDKKPAKLMIFSADWCGPCRAAKKAMKENVSLKRIIDSYEVVEYNFDHALPMRRKYKVNKVPTFIIVADGQEIKRQVGFSNLDKLKKFLD